MPDTKEPPTIHLCGPQTPECACKCPDGPCEHKWDGPEVTWDEGRSGSVTCSRCGMTSMSHSMWVGP